MRILANEPPDIRRLLIAADAFQTTREHADVFVGGKMGQTLNPEAYKL